MATKASELLSAFTVTATKVTKPEPKATPELVKSDPRFFLARPCTVEGVPWSTPEEFATIANEYFTACDLLERRPTLTGLTLALGLPGPASLFRLGQRAPVYRYLVSRAITAISHGYEQMLEGTKGAIFALKHLQDFDPEDVDGAPPVPFWQDKKELVVESNIPGLIDPRTRGRDMTPEEAYYVLVQGKQSAPIAIVEKNKHGVVEREVNPLTQLVTQRFTPAVPDEE